MDAQPDETLHYADGTEIRRGTPEFDNYVQSLIDQDQEDQRSDSDDPDAEPDGDTDSGDLMGKLDSLGSSLPTEQQLDSGKPYPTNVPVLPAAEPAGQQQSGQRGSNKKIEFKLTGKKLPKNQRSPQSEEDDTSALGLINAVDAPPPVEDGGLSDEELNAHVAKMGEPVMEQGGITDEQLEDYKSKLQTYNDSVHAEQTKMLNPDGMTDQELADVKQNMAVDKVMHGSFSETLAKGFIDGSPVTAAQAANTLKAHDDFFKEKRGLFETAFYNLSIPQQAITRQAVNILENINVMPTQDAKRILAHDSVMPSDLVNYYMRDDNYTGSGFVKATTGLAMDILTDPLNLIGVGLASDVKKAVIGGETILGLDKMSAAERMWFKSVEAAENIVGSDNKIVAQSAEKGDDFLKVRVAALRDKRLGFDSFARELGAGEETTKALTDLAQTHLTEKGVLGSLASGETELKFGFRLPFTNTFKEYRFPVMAGVFQKGAEIASQVYDSMGAALKASGADTFTTNIVKSLSSMTGKVLFDSQLRQYTGNIDTVKNNLVSWSKGWRRAFENIKNLEGEEGLGNYITDLVDHMERKPLTLEEAQSVATNVKGTAYNVNEGIKVKSVPTVIGGTEIEGLNKMAEYQDLRLHHEVTDLTKSTIQDDARLQRLQKYPQLLDFADETEQMNKNLLKQMHDRDIPIQELNPFGVGWAKRYVKHQFTDAWIQKFKAGSGEEAAIHTGMEYLEKLGGVDKSSYGREYRKSIKEANDAAMKDYGIKMFVDDPIHLVSARAQEVAKVIQNHDLLDAAGAYAKVGHHPGPGWTQFDWNKFGGLTIADVKDSAALKNTWNAYVPDLFKYNEHVFLPEDVMERTLLQINGRIFNTDDSPFISKGLDILDKLHTWFSNTALFGAGYLGQNFMSNAMVYSGVTGAQGMSHFYNATKAALFGTGEFILKDGMNARKVGAEEFLKEAIQHNITKSSMYGELKMTDLADGIASGYQQRKTLGKTLGEVADVAFMWKHSRAISETSDAIPKLGMFSYYRERGFSPEAAAGYVEKYFHDYRQGGMAQRVVSKVIPFSRFGMKTAEMIGFEARQMGGLARLRIPDKVQSVFQGAFVPDKDTQYVLTDQLRSTQQAQHPVLGPILPGLREIVMNPPWALGTIATFFDPLNSVHPIIKGMGAAMNYAGADEATQQHMEDFGMKAAAKNLYDMSVPWYIREAMARWDLQTNALGGHVAKLYEREWPADLENMKFTKGATGLLEEQASLQKITNDRSFADYMNTKSKDWFFNITMHGNPFPEGTLLHEQRETTKAEYLRQQFRQYTLGVGSMTKMDENFIFNYHAINAQAKGLEKKIQQFMVNDGRLQEADSLQNKAHLDVLSKIHPEARELLDLRRKQDALVGFYDFIYQIKYKNPGVDPLKVFFGVSESELDFSGKPHTFGEYTGNQPDQITNGVLDNVIDGAVKKLKKNDSKNQ